MKCSFLILAFLAFSAEAFSQNSFIRRYGEFSGKGNNLIINAENEYVITGQKGSGGNPAQFSFYKMNSDGDTLQLKLYGESISYDEPKQIIQTSNGGYAIIGTSIGTSIISGSSVSRKIYLVKTDQAGSVEWTRHFGTSWQEGYAIVQTNTGEYFLGGTRLDNGSSSADFYLIKITANGDTLWTKTYGGTGGEVITSMRQTTDGGLILAGYTGSYTNGGIDFYLVKTNSMGDTLWTNHYGGALAERPNSVRQTADGGYVVVGSSYSYGPAAYNIYVVRTNSLGDTIWTRSYGQSNKISRGNDIIQTPDGGFAITGEMGFDGYLLKIDSNGNTEWEKEFSILPPNPGPSTSTYLKSITQTQDGGYAMAGHWFSGSTYQLLLIKTNQNGVVGTTCTSLQSGWQLYPNPNSGEFSISFASQPEPGVLQVYDVLGKLVFQEAVAQWSQLKRLSLPQLKQGVYHCRISWGEKSGVVRFVKSE